MKIHTTALSLLAAIGILFATEGCSLFHRHHDQNQPPKFPKKPAVPPGPMEPDPQPMMASPVEPQPRPIEPQQQ